ncbi:MAG TPA: uroporphyrinogen decarboxylase family protein [Spirochaetota bacterium]|nr:uroporphyrinogen decarboxylase family protein [Spirochaetota bacterium]
MKRNMRQWTQEILASGGRCAFPLMAYAGADLCGMSIHDIVSDGKVHGACITALATRFPSAAFITAMDLSVEAEAFGSETQYLENETPTITGIIVHDAGEADSLTVPSVGAGRTGVYLEAAAWAAKEISPVFGCLIGPFSLAGRLCGMTETLMNVHGEPEMLHRVLNKTTEFLVNYARGFKAAGANGIVIAEPAAGLISPVYCDAFSSHYVSSIVDAVQDEEFMVVLHNCGGSGIHAASMASTGAAGLHFGNSADMKMVMKTVLPDILVFGNLDPVGVVRNGTGDDIRLATLQLLRDTAGYPNFVLSTGCDVPPGTPLQNIDSFFSALAEYNESVICGRCL